MIRKCSNYLATSETARVIKHSQQITRARDKWDYNKEYNTQSSESARWRILLKISCWVELLFLSRSRHSSINTVAWSRSVKCIWWGRTFAAFMRMTLQQMSVQQKESVWETHTTHFQGIFLDTSLCLFWRTTWQQQWSEDDALELMLFIKKKLKEKRRERRRYICSFLLWIIVVLKDAKLELI